MTENTAVRISEPAGNSAPVDRSAPVRPALVVVRLDDQQWDSPGTVTPVLGSLCGIAEPFSAVA